MNTLFTKLFDNQYYECWHSLHLFVCIVECIYDVYMNASASLIHPSLPICLPSWITTSSECFFLLKGSFLAFPTACCRAVQALCSVKRLETISTVTGTILLKLNWTILECVSGDFFSQIISPFTPGLNPVMVFIKAWPGLLNSPTSWVGHRLALVWMAQPGLWTTTMLLTTL